MNETIKPKRNTNPEGRCKLCGEILTKRKAALHLKKCRAAHPLPNGKTATKLFTIEATAPGLPEFFLVFELDGTKPLSMMDEFLRLAWFETYEHCSKFTINGVHYNSHQLSDDNAGFLTFLGRTLPRSMSAKMGDVLGEGVKFEYQYDFGTTSYVRLRVIGIRSTLEKTPNGPDLIMQNLRPKFSCGECGQPATIVGAGSWGLHPKNIFCEACAGKKVDEELRCPIANSPRSGIDFYGF